jgi:hypothetical protein
MVEKFSFRNKLLPTFAGIGFGLLSSWFLLVEHLQQHSFPPSLEIRLRFGNSLIFYKDGLVSGREILCSSIPIQRGEQSTGEYLSGGSATRKVVIYSNNKSISAYGNDDFSNCYRPWVLERQNRQSVQ